jgi:hypothetical protein
MILNETLAIVAYAVIVEMAHALERDKAVMASYYLILSV